MTMIDTPPDRRVTDRLPPILLEQLLASPIESKPVRVDRPFNHEQMLPNGPAAAAIVAAGLGSVALGLLIILAEYNLAAKQFMTLDSGVGPLSGKATFAVIVWLAAWGVLHLIWRKRQVDFRRAFFATAVLIVIALITTFPPFFMLFAVH